MQLALSSAAAPDLDLPALLELCARRGLAGVELQLGSADRELSAETLPELAGGTTVRSGSARLLAFRAQRSDIAGLGHLARVAGSAGVPAIVGWPDALEGLEHAAGLFRTAGARLLLEVDSDARRAEAIVERIDACGPDVLGLAWDVRPGHELPAAPRKLLEIAGERLHHVRLFGGGPESVSQTGQGVGALMARLTLARFTGPLVLTPSTSRFHEAWSRWLGRNGGWGCGSKDSDPSLVQISA
jgi:hypothetical protein